MEPHFTLTALCLGSSLSFVLFGIHFFKEASRFSDTERSIKAKRKNKRLGVISLVFSLLFLAFAYYASL